MNRVTPYITTFNTPAQSEGKLFPYVSAICEYEYDHLQHYTRTTTFGVQL